VLRKVARQVAEGKKGPVRITRGSVRRFLGPKRILKEDALDRDQVGVATGLAWTPAGGDIMFVETTLMPGKGDLTLTGQLGDVMKESARAALSYIRSHAAEYGIESSLFTERDIHIHVPEGAIPKDGPSAGITLATSLVSALCGRPVDRALAMTGEITLRGEVLPVGGIKEKVLAARRARVGEVLLPDKVRPELEEIPARLRRDLSFSFVSRIEEVLQRALAAPVETD
jgi:ATP-dependent Lon protease